MPKLLLLGWAGVCLSISLLSGCAQNPSTEPSTTAVASTSSTTPSEASKAQTAMSSAKTSLTPVGVKSIKQEPDLKRGKKLSPKEVEDLIRKLSVCHPV